MTVAIEPPQTFDDLCADISWPLSRLYHQHSKLSPAKEIEFHEQIASFNQDPDAVRDATESYILYPNQPSIELPRRRRRLLSGRLGDILRRRRTRRAAFSDRPMTLQHWGVLLGESCGVTGAVTHPEFPGVTQRLRACPSGGGFYPIEIRLFSLRTGELECGTYHYQVPTHKLACLGGCPDAEDLSRTVYADGLWENASGLLVLTAVFGRTQVKYGERGYRFVLLDAGHLAQNMLLVTEDIGLAAVPLGGFDDDALAKQLGLTSGDEMPVYAILVGVRAR